MRQIRIVSDGMGTATHVYLEDGTQISPTEAIIFLEATSVNKAELIFLGTALDVHVDLQETTMTCPICQHKQTHYCSESL